MPSKEVLQRKRESEMARTRITVIIVLKSPGGRLDYIPIPEECLKDEQSNFSRNVLASISPQEPVIYLDNYDPRIFRFFATYCLRLPLSAQVDLPRQFTSYAVAIRNISVTVNSYHTPEITMGLLSDTAYDRDTSAMRTARRLIFAYFLGQHMGAPYFQDALMNHITKNFRADQPPSPAFVKEIYHGSNSTRLYGLKKFLVDYYIWIRAYVDSGRYPPLENYLPAFIGDVANTSRAIDTEVVIDSKDLLKRTETKDVVMDFPRLGAFLCNARQGRLKCRYHHHTSMERCHNLIVDDTPIAC